MQWISNMRTAMNHPFSLVTNLFTRYHRQRLYQIRMCYKMSFSPHPTLRRGCQSSVARQLTSLTPSLPLLMKLFMLLAVSNLLLALPVQGVVTSNALNNGGNCAGDGTGASSTIIKETSTYLLTQLSYTASLLTTETASISVNTVATPWALKMTSFQFNNDGTNTKFNDACSASVTIPTLSEVKSLTDGNLITNNNQVLVYDLSSSCYRWTSGTASNLVSYRLFATGGVPWLSSCVTIAPSADKTCQSTDTSTVMNTMISDFNSISQVPEIMRAKFQALLQGTCRLNECYQRQSTSTDALATVTCTTMLTFLSASTVFDTSVTISTLTPYLYPTLTSLSDLRALLMSTQAVSLFSATNRDSIISTCQAWVTGNSIQGGGIKVIANDVQLNNVWNSLPGEATLVTNVFMAVTMSVQSMTFVASTDEQRTSIIDVIRSVQGVSGVALWSQTLTATSIHNYIVNARLTGNCMILPSATPTPTDIPTIPSLCTAGKILSGAVETWLTTTMLSVVTAIRTGLTNIVSALNSKAASFKQLFHPAEYEFVLCLSGVLSTSATFLSELENYLSSSSTINSLKYRPFWESGNASGNSLQYTAFVNLSLCIDKYQRRVDLVYEFISPSSTADCNSTAVYMQCSSVNNNLNNVPSFIYMAAGLGTVTNFVASDIPGNSHSSNLSFVNSIKTNSINDGISFMDSESNELAQPVSTTVSPLHRRLLSIGCPLPCSALAGKFCTVTLIGGQLTQDSYQCADCAIGFYCPSGDVIATPCSNKPGGSSDTTIAIYTNISISTKDCPYLCKLAKQYKVGDGYGDGTACADVPIGSYSPANSNDCFKCTYHSPKLSPFYSFTSNSDSDNCAVGAALQSSAMLTSSSTFSPIAQLLLASTVTMEAWIRLVPSTVSNSQTVGIMGVTALWGITLETNSQGQSNMCYYRYSGAPAKVCTSVITVNNSYFHLAVTRRNTIVTLYINGIANGSGNIYSVPSWKGADTASYFVMGGNSIMNDATSNSLAVFSVNEVRLYNGGWAAESLTHLGYTSTDTMIKLGCDLSTHDLCNNQCTKKCVHQQNRDSSSCQCNCGNSSPQLCRGQCWPSCTNGMIRLDNCGCGCANGDVSVWKLRYLMITTVVNIQDNSNNYYGDKNSKNIGLSDVEFRDTSNNVIKPVSCLSNDGGLCDTLSDGLTTNGNDSIQWHTTSGQGYMSIVFDFGTVINLTKVSIYNYNGNGISNVNCIKQVMIYGSLTGKGGSSGVNSGGTGSNGVGGVGYDDVLTTVPIVLPNLYAKSPSLVAGSSLSPYDATVVDDRSALPSTSPLLSCMPCSPVIWYSVTSQLPRSSMSDCKCLLSTMKRYLGIACLTQLSIPSVSLPGGVYDPAVLISARPDLADTTATMWYDTPVVVRYTIDNTSPTSISSILSPSSPVTLLPLQLLTLQTQSYQGTVRTESNIVTSVYKGRGSLSATASPPSGKVKGVLTVTLSCTQTPNIPSYNFIVCYTIDGSNPSSVATSSHSAGAVTIISQSTTNILSSSSSICKHAPFQGLTYTADPLLKITNIQIKYFCQALEPWFNATTISTENYQLYPILPIPSVITGGGNGINSPLYRINQVNLSYSSMVNGANILFNVTASGSPVPPLITTNSDGNSSDPQNEIISTFTLSSTVPTPSLISLFAWSPYTAPLILSCPDNMNSCVITVSTYVSKTDWESSSILTTTVYVKQLNRLPILLPPTLSISSGNAPIDSIQLAKTSEVVSDSRDPTIIIRYTSDDTAPTITSNVFPSAGIPLSTMNRFVIRAITTQQGRLSSKETVSKVDVIGKLSLVVVTAEGTYDDNVVINAKCVGYPSISLSSTQPSLYYTMDGSVPSHYTSSHAATNVSVVASVPSKTFTLYTSTFQAFCQSPIYQTSTVVATTFLIRPKSPQVVISETQQISASSPSSTPLEPINNAVNGQFINEASFNINAVVEGSAGTTTTTIRYRTTTLTLSLTQAMASMSQWTNVTGLAATTIKLTCPQPQTSCQVTIWANSQLSSSIQSSVPSFHTIRIRQMNRLTPCPLTSISPIAKQVNTTSLITILVLNDTMYQISDPDYMVRYTLDGTLPTSSSLLFPLKKNISILALLLLRDGNTSKRRLYSDNFLISLPSQSPWSTQSQNSMPSNVPTPSPTATSAPTLSPESYLTLTYITMQDGRKPSAVITTTYAVYDYQIYVASTQSRNQFSVGTPLMIGVVAGGSSFAILIIAVSIIVVFVYRRRRQNKNDSSITIVSFETENDIIDCNSNIRDENCNEKRDNEDDEMTKFGLLMHAAVRGNEHNNEAVDIHETDIESNSEDFNTLASSHKPLMGYDDITRKYNVQEIFECSGSENIDSLDADVLIQYASMGVGIGVIGKRDNDNDIPQLQLRSPNILYKDCGGNGNLKEMSTISNIPIWHQSIHMCWICGMTDISQHLITPCLCEGDFQYAHYDCLNKWMTTTSLGDSCAVCTNLYNFALNQSDKNRTKNESELVVDRNENDDVNESEKQTYSNLIKSNTISVIDYNYEDNNNLAKDNYSLYQEELVVDAVSQLPPLPPRNFIN